MLISSNKHKVFLQVRPFILVSFEVQGTSFCIHLVQALFLKWDHILRAQFKKPIQDINFINKGQS